MIDYSRSVVKYIIPFYCGCGFHYYKVGQLSKFLAMTMYPWKPCANHLDKIEDGFHNSFLAEVIFDGIEEDLAEAELCIKERATGNCGCEKRRDEK